MWAIATGISYKGISDISQKQSKIQPLLSCQLFTAPSLNAIRAILERSTQESKHSIRTSQSSEPLATLESLSHVQVTGPA